MIGLICLPLFLVLALIIKKRQKVGYNTFGQQEIFQRFTRFSTKRKTILLYAISLSLLVIAGTEPWLASNSNITSRTYNTIIVVDVSRSMLAEDGPGGQSRLKAGIDAVEALMNAYPDGQFGFVFYTDEIMIYPPSKDPEAIKTLLLEFGEGKNIRGEGSDLVGALEKTGDYIEKMPYKPQTIVLIADGGTHYKDYNKRAIKDLIDMNVRVVSVGVGGLVPVRVPVYENGEPVGYYSKPTSLNIGIMGDVAEDTDGYFLHLENGNDIADLVREKNLDTDPLLQEATESMTWLPVTVSMLLICFWIFLRNRTK